MRAVMTGVVTALILLIAASANAGGKASLSSRDITEHLFTARPGERPDLSGQVLTRLDLAGLNFKAAKLIRTNMFGADLSEANLSGANLSGANLDRTTLMATRFDDANLEGASFLRPSVFSTLSASPAEAPSFARARLRAAKIFGRLSHANFVAADLTDASCAPFGKIGFIEEIFRTEFAGANFTGATLERANLEHVLFAFANLSGANLRNANLSQADLTGADLTDADLTGADVTGADLTGVKLAGVKGFETVRGLALARNADKALR